MGEAGRAALKTLITIVINLIPAVGAIPGLGLLVSWLASFLVDLIDRAARERIVGVEVLDAKRAAELLAAGDQSEETWQKFKDARRKLSNRSV